MVIAINSAIETRGISGTARVAGFIADALDACEEMTVARVYPPDRPESGRIRRAMFDAHWDLRGAVRSAPCDVLVSPCNIGYGGRVPHVLWIQDVMPLDHPEWFDRAFALYAKGLFGFSAKRSTQVVTASRAAAAGIERRWPSAAPVAVIPWPVDRPPGQVRSFPAGMLRALVVGATEVHKNHVAAVRAVHLLRAESGADISLVIAGPEGRAEVQLEQVIRASDPSGIWIRRLKGLSRAQIERQLDEAWVLMQPSLDEGFGLPLTEAAVRGLPVIHSGRGPMSEILPASSADSVTPETLCRVLGTLLDPIEYNQASKRVLDRSRDYSKELFDSRVKHVVRAAACREDADRDRVAGALFP